MLYHRATEPQSHKDFYYEAHGCIYISTSWFEYIFSNRVQENIERTNDLIRFSFNYFQKHKLELTDQILSPRIF